MANPMEGITLLFVSGTTAIDGEYHKAGDKLTGFLVISWSKSGVCRAFWNYSEKSSGMAGGYGYAKDGVAAAEALNKIFGTTIHNNGEGLPHTVREARSQGLSVVETYQIDSNVIEGAAKK